MNRALASSVNSAPHLSIFYDIVNDRLAALQLTDILTNMIDTAPAEMLPFLARQFYVDGERGYAYMVRDDQKRELIKSAMKLNGKSGTPWAIKEVLRIAGYPGIYFQEGISKLLDGTWYLDDKETLGSEGWASFKAFYPTSTPLSSDTLRYIGDIIKGLMPVRCYLVSVENVII